YQASSYLHTGRVPMRAGNRHPSICPYETFAAQDGHFNLAIGNDSQWRMFCVTVNRLDLLDDDRFATNPQRVAHRDGLFPILTAHFQTLPVAHWLELLDRASIPCGPI